MHTRTFLYLHCTCTCISLTTSLDLHGRIILLWIPLVWGGNQLCSESVYYYLHGLFSCTCIVCIGGAYRLMYNVVHVYHCNVYCVCVLIVHVYQYNNIMCTMSCTYRAIHRQLSTSKCQGISQPSLSLMSATCKYLLYTYAHCSYFMAGMIYWPESVT